MAAALPFLTVGMRTLQTTAQLAYPMLQAQASSMLSKTRSAVVEGQAAQAVADASSQAAQQTLQYRQATGTLRNQLGVSGVRQAGSVADRFSFDRALEDQALDDIRYQGALKASRFRNQAMLTRMEGNNQQRLLLVQAGTRLLQRV